MVSVSSEKLTKSEAKRVYYVFSVLGVVAMSAG